VKKWKSYQKGVNDLHFLSRKNGIFRKMMFFFAFAMQADF